MSQHIYIPVSSKSLEAIFKAGASFITVLEGLCLDEILGLCAVQMVPSYVQSSEHPSGFERNLEHLFLLAKDKSKRGQLSSLKQELISHIEYDKLKIGTKEMYRLGLRLVNAKVIQQRDYLDYYDEWDYEFSTKYPSMISLNGNGSKTNGSTSLLTNDQLRITTIINEGTNDHLHIQAYAGTGKTFMIQELLSRYEVKGCKPESLLILTHNKAQLNGLPLQIRKKYSCQTFGETARNALPSDYQHTHSTVNMNYNLSQNVIAKCYQLENIIGLTDSEVIRLITGTLTKFCNSTDDFITKNHLPKEPRLKASIAQLIITKARDYWAKILNPASQDVLIIRAYHQVKLATILKMTVPSKFKHIIVDEAHDLSPAMLQFLDASPQPYISLGDCYQNLDGLNNRSANSFREYQITDSFRSGNLLSEVINPIIRVHPFGTKAPFQGSSEVPTSIEYYNEATIPERPAAIIVSDEWAVWEWVQRLSNKGIEYRLLSSLKDLDNFVSAVLNLKEKGIKPRHGALKKFDTWDSLIEGYKKNRSFNKIFEMLDRGYTSENWAEAKSMHKQSVGNHYTVVRATDSRNHEFDCVMLTPDLIDLISSERKKGVAKRNSALYVAVTRVKHVLIAPIAFRHWIEAVSGR